MKKEKGEKVKKETFEITQMLRTCSPKMEGANQRLKNGQSVSAEPFIWEEGKVLVAEDYDPRPVCGGGLHGLKNGLGNWGLLDWDPECVGVIFENVDCPIIDIDGEKVKVQKARIVETGPFPTMLAKFLPTFIQALTVVAEVDVITVSPAKIGSSGDSAKIGSSGDYAKIGSSGDSAQIGSSGDSAQIGSSGYSAKIGSSGYYAKIGSSGDYAKIGSSGDSAQIGSSGYSAQIGSSGDYARLRATGDDSVIANAGLDGCGKIGKNGALALTYKDAAGRYRIAVGYEGEGLTANTWYRVDENGQFIETGEQR